MVTPSTPALRLRHVLRGVSPAHSRLLFSALAALLLGWTALRVTKAGDAHRAALRDVRASLAAIQAWRGDFRAAAPAESLTWRRATVEAQELGVAGDERLALTQAIARTAEAAGLRDVRVRAVPPDTTGAEARLSSEGVLRQPAPFGLLVECRGSLQAVVTLLGQLPPSVAATSIELVRQDGRARHRLMLAVYELGFANVTSHGSPAERGNSRPGRAGRGGG